MFTQMIRFVTFLAVIGIVGTAGVVRAVPPSLADTAISLAAASSPGVQFVHVATADNTAGTYTFIDHPLLNNNPSAVIIATPNWNPGGGSGVYNDHPIAAVYFSPKWLIVNQDIASMPAYAAFNVLVPKAGPNAFVHTATVTNTFHNYTLIDNPLTNGKPNAKILVTPGDTTNSHPIGVWYNGTKWGIFNQDSANMPTGTFFNVFVIPETYAGGFVHQATAANISGNYTVIDHPLINGNPNAIVFVTPNWNPGNVGGTYNNHNIGIWYSSSQQKWAIFNQDLAAMPVNAAFNVLVLVPQSDVFVHKATSANIFLNYSLIDHPLSNADPNAIVFVTSNWNPGGSSSGIYNNQNIGVWYSLTNQKWSVFNQNTTAPMPNNAAFNVLIPHPDASVFVHKATTGNTSGHITTIDYPLTNNKPNAILLVTPNWNPGGVGGTYNNHPIGVYYTGGKWTIFNQDFAAMPPNAAFNVIVPRPGPGEAVFVHQASAANTISHVTFIDHPLTNGNPTALVLVTPNWNPGGGGGTYNNHPIGVYYDVFSGKWAIFNQNLDPMPLNAAFNVYVRVNQVYVPLIIR
ncbi:hypothetical protein QTO31_18370 [Chloroflexus sp. MS-CIW-1]|uniref:DUF7452 domain-containing protein n=1 Tax=Chloroflexus sp. MS-CIW-1 TaxID=3055768 RepID=UPI0026484B03|nr:hypothetical protein [Chloroflexus sp. MS-CIW-1]MDN5273937.1 hypothetical protein [Chloroflexus sp. MS-CIW-1]